MDWDNLSQKYLNMSLRLRACARYRLAVVVRVIYLLLP